jgi:hypothetical protein
VVFVARWLFGTRRVLVPTIVVAVAMAPVFWRYYIASGDDSSDHAAHIKMIREGKIPTYPLFHLSVQGLATGIEIYADQLQAFRSWPPLAAYVEGVGRLTYGDRLCQAAAAVLTLACTATAALSAGYLASRTRASTFALTVTCLGLALAMPFPTVAFLEILRPTNFWRANPTPGHGIFLGQVSPNVWHNPTTIFAMPFAVALFRLAIRAIEGFTVRTAVELAVATMLCLLAKPNYVLALLPCVVVVLALSPVSWIDRVLRFVAAFILPLAILWGQAAVLVGPKGDVGEEMVLSPFEVWEHFTRNIPLSTFVGIVFPLCVLIAYHGRFRTEMPLKVAWVALGTAVLQYCFLIEGGDRKMNGNWGWGMMFADRVLFLATCDYLLRQRLDAKKVICYACFLFHVACGLYYLRRCMIDPRWSVFF